MRRDKRNTWAFAWTLSISLHLLFFLFIDIQENTLEEISSLKTIEVVALFEENPPLLKESKREELAKKEMQKILAHMKAIPFLQLTVNTSDFFEPPTSQEETLVEAFSEEPFYYPEVECRLLGLLRNRPCSKKQEELIAWGTHVTRFTCVFEVCIEGCSGKIIFSRLLKGAPPLDIVQKAAAYISSLQFSPFKELLIKGSIELTLTK